MGKEDDFIGPYIKFTHNSRRKSKLLDKRKASEIGQ